MLKLTQPPERVSRCDEMGQRVALHEPRKWRHAANVEPVLVREADGLHVAFRCMSDVSPGEQLLFDCLELCSGQCYIHDSGGLPDHGVDRGLDQGASTNGPLPANQRMRTTRWADDQTADDTDVEPVVERASQCDRDPLHMREPRH